MILVTLQPHIERGHLTSLLGSDDERVPGQVDQVMEQWEEKAVELMEPRLAYNLHKILVCGKGSVRLEEGVELKSPRLSRSLEGCHEMVCFIATVGRGIEKEVDKLTEENRLSDAFILDAMGSVGVENLVEQFYQRMLVDYRSQGRSLSLRFSPGYCDWPVSGQKKLFQLMAPELIGVELLESCLMESRKSISGVFGVCPLGRGRVRPAL
jgi:hypothetical protein